MIYDLPLTVEVSGVEYAIRSDYRAILDICIALSDPDLTAQDKAYVTLTIFYIDFDDMPASDYKEAIERCFWFINCGAEENAAKRVPKLMDWEQDFQFIVSPINRVMGKEIRALEYMHWWTFISAYYEIGDCLFAQIVRIRDLKARRKKLEKNDAEFYRKNRDLIDIKPTYSEQEKEVLKAWF